MKEPFLTTLPPGLEEEDRRLTAEIDGALALGYRRGARHVVCRRGCTACCIGPFDISGLDAARLGRGLAELQATAPASAAAVVGRAREQWSTMAAVFPGTREDGWLAADEASREAFFIRFETAPCPALDPVSGSCVLYPHRPLSCRTYGLPIRVGVAALEPCPLNFAGAGRGAVKRSTVAVDPRDREGELVAMAREAGVPMGDTIVVAVLALWPGEATKDARPTLLKP